MEPRALRSRRLTCNHTTTTTQLKLGSGDPRVDKPTGGRHTMGILQDVRESFSREHLPLLIVHLNIVMYAFNYWFTKPMLPYLTKELGADAVVFGWLQTSFSLFQLVGGPIIGKLVDVKGARFALNVSQVSAGLSYLMLGLSTNMTMLFLGQLPTFGMHAMHAAQAYITITSEEESRAKSLGRLSLSYGIGFVFGPFLGGTCSKYIGYQNTGLVAGALSLAVVLLTSLYLPVVHPSAAAAAQPAADKPAPSTKNIFGLLFLPDVRGLIIAKLLAGLAIALFHSNFSIVAQERFHMDPQQNGAVMSFVGVLSIVVNTFFVGWVTKLSSDRQVVQGAMLALAASFAMLSHVTQTYELLFCMIPLGFAGTTTSTVVTSSLTKSVAKDAAGTILGLDMAAGSFSRVIAPTVSGYIYKYYGYSTVLLSSATLALTAFVWVNQFQAGSGVLAADHSKAQVHPKPSEKKNT